MISHGLSDGTYAQILRIVEQELIGGHVASIGLCDLDEDRETLGHAGRMTIIFNDLLAAHGSDLRVRPVATFYFPPTDLGDVCYLGIYDQDLPGELEMLFTFGCYDPAITWHQRVPGKVLMRQLFEDSSAKVRGRVAAAAAVADVVVKLEMFLRRRLLTMPLSDNQRRRIREELGRPGSPKDLNFLAYICEILELQFSTVLSEAFRTR